jgi:C2 domain
MPPAAVWPTSSQAAPAEESRQAREGKERDKMTTESISLDMQRSPTDSEAAVCLEGILHTRKGGTWTWKRRFVLFNFLDGGSVAVYKIFPGASSNRDVNLHPTSVLRTVYSRFQRSRSVQFEAGELEISLSPDLPWIAKDVENDPSTFVLEIPTNDDDLENDVTANASQIGRGNLQVDDYVAFDSDDDDDDIDTISGDPSMVEENNKMAALLQSENLQDDLSAARRRGKPLRIYFRCHVETNEKALWLKAFSNLGRLSSERRQKKSVFSSLTSNMLLGTSRTRSLANEHIARDTRHLDLTDEPFDADGANLTDKVELMARRGKTATKDKEFRILPSYAYPHQWLTKAEMKEEMVLPSNHFHDLRVPGYRLQEIGSLKVEVLQCLGLPKLDRGSDTDAVAYLVCGSYAFSTDTIYNRTNPMWLRKSRRACVFPLFHGYARLYVGVFDDESRRVKDDFAGRFVVDLARLRPRSTYDVTLPLRLSTHIYSRRRRGAIRLRLTLTWKSERDALLSYLPKKIRIPLPQHSKPNVETTVLCSDQKAFRNIAITVHGAHLPGRFTFNQMRAAIREVNFTRKFVFTALRKVVRETRNWHNPAMSAFVLFSWMHCIYENAFSLVPAYVILYFFLFLLQNYARFCTDGPGVRGFIPPSWEELFMALVRGGDPDYNAIEPLELDLRPSKRIRRNSPESIAISDQNFRSPQYNINTHIPRGKKLFQALGFLSAAQKDPDDDHIEFPFADGKEYPKFTVRECLVTHGTEVQEVPIVENGAPTGRGLVRSATGLHGSDFQTQGMMHRFPLEKDLQRMMRKDTSGTKDYDEEEDNFYATKAVMNQGTSS